MRNPADVVQLVARLPFPAEDDGASPVHRLQFTTATVQETRPLLAAHHYLGPTNGGRYAFAGWVADEMVACQVWRHPTARHIPSDWLELSRWCLTSQAGRNAGSLMMGWASRWLRRNTDALTLVSYSDLSRHSGALYRASGWRSAPTHHTERFMADGVGYPSGHGSWDGVTTQSPKQRWIFELWPTGKDET